MEPQEVTGTATDLLDLYHYGIFLTVRTTSHPGRDDSGVGVHRIPAGISAGV
jgi:hypothetical protein